MKHVNKFLKKNKLHQHPVRKGKRNFEGQMASGELLIQSSA